MTYPDALAYIASLEPRGWRLGLDRMAEFVRRAQLDDHVGGPNGAQFIHVAGTNGKGSTTAYLQSMLVESGHRTGAFFSPYVVDPRERVQFGRQLIEPEELAEITEAMKPIADSLSETEFGGVTEFEFKTAVGFEYWRSKACDWVALEVGLGGRLDATNVVHPHATVIVSISLDHTTILGTTVEQIAREKAGIIKPGVPVIVGDIGGGALEVIRGVASENAAPVWLYGRDIAWDNGDVVTPIRRHRSISLGLSGSKQEVNAAVAIGAIDAAGAWRNEIGIQQGAANAWAPGRFQRVWISGKQVVFDGAHNPEAAGTLSAGLQGVLGKGSLILVTNMLTGHEPEEFYSRLGGPVRSVHVAPIDFHRARAPGEMAEKLGRLFDDVTVFDSVGAALEAAVARADRDDVVVVTGSFYLVGEALRAVGAIHTGPAQ